MSKTHFQVRDTRTKMPVPGCDAMMMLGNAQYVAQKCNRRSRAKVTRYVIIRVDPDNLPFPGADHDPTDVVSEFADC